MSLKSFARHIIENVAPDEDDTGMTKIHPDIYVKNRSINLLVGKPGTSKTTSICEELIKISALNIPEFHLIIWVNNTSSDKTVNTYKNFIQIPLIQLDYDTFNDVYPKFLQMKDDYNKMINNEIPKDHSILDALYIDNFTTKPLQTIIILDDAVNVLKDTESFLAKSLYRTRHSNTIFFIAIQIWKGITAQLKSILNSVWIFGGFSPQILHHIHNQISTDMSFDEFKYRYDQLKKYQKLIFDLSTGELAESRPI